MDGERHLLGKSVMNYKMCVCVCLGSGEGGVGWRID